jgi:hypothetical protein
MKVWVGVVKLNILSTLCKYNLKSPYEWEGLSIRRAGKSELLSWYAIISALNQGFKTVTNFAELLSGSSISSASMIPSPLTSEGT